MPLWRNGLGRASVRSAQSTNRPAFRQQLEQNKFHQVDLSNKLQRPRILKSQAYVNHRYVCAPRPYISAGLRRSGENDA